MGRMARYKRRGLFPRSRFIDELRSFSRVTWERVNYASYSCCGGGKLILQNDRRDRIDRSRSVIHHHALQLGNACVMKI